MIARALCAAAALALAACGASPPPAPPALVGAVPVALLDLSRALELPPATLCRRVGLGACRGQPFDLDRASIAACMVRRDLDLATPADALIWRALPLADGALTDLDHPAVRGAVDRLFLRTQLVGTDTAQWVQLRDLYRHLARDRPKVFRDWAVLACFGALQQLKHW